MDTVPVRHSYLGNLHITITGDHCCCGQIQYPYPTAIWEFESGVNVILTRLNGRTDIAVANIDRKSVDQVTGVRFSQSKGFKGLEVAHDVIPPSTIHIRSNKNSPAILFEIEKT